MNVCGKCEAENSTGAKFCQMCATPLAGADAADGERAIGKPNPSLLTTEVFSIEASEPRICPVCEAVNEGDWAFCQQCGSKLDQPPVDELVQEEVEPKQQPCATTIHVSQPVRDLKKAAPSHVACPQCSQQVVAGGAFCHKCGASINNSRTVAMSSLRAVPKPAAKARLLLVVDGEATGDEFEIGGETVVGRIDGDITFPHDDYLSGRHARVAKRGDKFVLIDEDSRNGCFIRIKKEVEINPGDFILLGKQLFRFEV